MGFRVLGSCGLGGRVYGVGVYSLGYRDWASGFSVGFRGPGYGFRLGFGV